MWYYWIITLLIFSCCVVPVQAGIYQCVGESGVIEFRDKPCQSSLEQQAFLPIKYKKTEEKLARKQEKEIKLINKELDQKEKQSERLKERTKKQQEKESAKAERRKIRCARLDEKIKTIEDQLKRGCKIKRNIRLNEQLAHCENMKRKYCSE